MGATRRKPGKQSTKKKTKHKLGSALGAVAAHHQGKTLKPQKIREKKNASSARRSKSGTLRVPGARLLGEPSNADAEYTGLAARVAAKASHEKHIKTRMPRPVFTPATFSLSSAQTPQPISVDALLGEDRTTSSRATDSQPTRKPASMNHDLSQGSQSGNRFALLQEPDPASKKPMFLAPASFDLEPMRLQRTVDALNLHSNDDEDDDDEL